MESDLVYFRENHNFKFENYEIRVKVRADYFRVLILGRVYSGNAITPKMPYFLYITILLLLFKQIHFLAILGLLTFFIIASDFSEKYYKKKFYKKNGQPKIVSDRIFTIQDFNKFPFKPKLEITKIIRNPKASDFLKLSLENEFFEDGIFSNSLYLSEKIEDILKYELALINNGLK